MLWVKDMTRQLQVHHALMQLACRIVNCLHKPPPVCHDLNFTATPHTHSRGCLYSLGAGAKLQCTLVAGVGNGHKFTYFLQKRIHKGHAKGGMVARQP